MSCVECVLCNNNKCHYGKERNILRIKKFIKLDDIPKKRRLYYKIIIKLTHVRLDNIFEKYITLARQAGRQADMKSSEPKAEAL